MREKADSRREERGERGSRERERETVSHTETNERKRRGQLLSCSRRSYMFYQSLKPADSPNVTSFQFSSPQVTFRAAVPERDDRVDNPHFFSVMINRLTIRGVRPLNDPIRHLFIHVFFTFSCSFLSFIFFLYVHFACQRDLHATCTR